MSIAVIPPLERQAFFTCLRERLHDNRGLMALILVDIQSFNRVNHMFSCAVGDYLLYAIKQRLEAAYGSPHQVFRIDGDEFAVVVSGLFDSTEVGRDVSVTVDHCTRPFDLQGTPLAVDVQVGAAYHSGEPIDAESLYRDAELALHDAKAKGNTVNIVPSGTSGTGILKYATDQKILDALRDGRLESFFQAKIDCSNGKVAGAESLIRLPLADGEIIGAEPIIEVLERFDREFELTKWVLNNGLRHWEMLSNGDPDFKLSINVSAKVVHHPDFYNFVVDAIGVWNVRPEGVVLELTEGALIEDFEDSQRHLSKLKAFGVGVSIDDFGTGYSSLAYFKEIPATELKIDMSFILNMLDHQGDRDIVQLIIDLAHRFNLDVVAEGVEDLPTSDALRQMGCDFQQGFYFTKPLQTEEFCVWHKLYKPVADVSNPDK